ncbi:MAG: PEP-CTERM sorting domain-containing protein [Desulforhopalus sp.]|nr:PEP-CTERM sorting domain-containing protein [Desulforhopalus sp.]
MKKLHYIAALLLMTSATHTQAATIYTYTGNSFTDYWNFNTHSTDATLTTPDDIVTGNFVIESAMLPNRTYWILSGGPISSFSFTSGGSTISNENLLDFSGSLYPSGNPNFWVNTNALGEISHWFITLANQSSSAAIYSRFVEDGSLNYDQFSYVSSYSHSAEWVGYNTSSPGTWTQRDSNDPVPEPTTMVLFGLGISGLLGSKLKRKRREKTKDSGQLR